MKIRTLSVGRPQTREYRGRAVQTGIFKQAVTEPCAVSYTNIAGDEQADLSVHGGRDKAIYAYSNDYYAEWATYFGRPTVNSQFGENLTIDGGKDEDVVLGARYRIGTIECLVAQPRIPCFKLGILVGDEDFPNHFWSIGRLGFYLRVEQEGTIRQGDEIIQLDVPEHGISIRRLYDIVQNREKSAAEQALALLPHLDSGWQRRLRMIV